MKRVLAILTILLLLMVPVTAFATTKTYEIPELGMRINIPEELMVFPRDVDPNDPNLAVVGLDEKTLEQNSIDNHLYLRAVQLDPLEMTHILMIDTDKTKRLYDFNLLSDKELDAYYKDKAEDGAKDHRTYLGYSIYKHPQATFLCIKIQDDEHPTEGIIEYDTILNGKGIGILFTPADFNNSQEQEKMLRDMVDSVYFTQENKSQNPSVQASTTAGDKTNASAQTSLLNKILEKALGGVLAGAAAGGAVAIWAAIKKKRNKNESDYRPQ